MPQRSALKEVNFSLGGCGQSVHKPPEPHWPIGAALWVRLYSWEGATHCLHQEKLEGRKGREETNRGKEERKQREEGRGENV